MDNKENKIVEILSQYEPGGPRNGLRDAIFGESPEESRPNKGIRWFWRLSAAAAILIATGSAIYFGMNEQSVEIREPVAAMVKNDGAENTVYEDEVDIELPDMDEIEYRIKCSGLAARRLAYADMLSEGLGSKEEAIEQYKSVIDNYSEYDAAETAREKLISMQKGI